MYFHFRYVAIVSGLEIGSKEEQMFSFQLFLDMVTGQLGDVGQQQGSANIVGVVIAGNSLSKDTQDKDSLNKVGIVKDNGLSPITSIDKESNNFANGGNVITSFGNFFPYLHISYFRLQKFFFCFIVSHC